MTIRWGILGAGRIAAKFASDLALVPDACLQAVQARDPHRRAEFAERFGARRQAATLEELLAGGDLDVVYIATPHMLHAAGARACLEAGVPCLVEKPFGLTRSEVEPVVELARAAGIFCMEALWTRFLPHFVEALRLVEGGAIGEPISIEADFGFEANRDPSSRLFDPALGGGSLLDIGIYPLFLARSLLGNPHSVDAAIVAAETGVDLSCRIELGWPGGARAALFSTFAESTPCEAVIRGTKGALRLLRMFHAPTDLVVLDAEGRPTRREFPREGHGYQHEILHVGDCLRQGLRESPLWSLSDSLELAALLDRVAQAGRGAR